LTARHGDVVPVCKSSAVRPTKSAVRSAARPAADAHHRNAGNPSGNRKRVRTSRRVGLLPCKGNLRRHP
jgi:hypothetical protein